QNLLVSAGIPCVMVSSTEVNRPIPHVFPDGFDAGFQAGQHLVKRGCKRATYISPYRSWWAQQRGAGLTAAFEQAGFSASAVKVYPGEAALEWSVVSQMYDEAFATALVALRDVTPDCGVVGANDDIAVATQDAGETLGLKPG